MVVNKYDLKKKWDAISKDNSYSLEQKRTIKYAMGIIGINEDLIINPNIPSDYMDMYIKMMIKGIDVTKYIVNQWRLNDIKVEDLEKTILAENQSKIILNDDNVSESTITNTKQKVIRRNS